MRIRWRLALLGTVLATGTIGLFAVLILFLAAGGTPRDADEALDALAVEAASVYRPGTPAPARIVDPTTSTERFVIVADADGRVVYSEARWPAASSAAAAQLPAAVVLETQRAGSSRATATIGGVELRVAARPWSGGVVVAAQSARYVEGQLSGLRAVLVIAALLTAVAGAVASWVVSGRALRPVRALAATAGDVARTGDLSRRLPVPGGRDEVAALANGFNAMMDRLQAGQAGLAAALEEQRRFVADASHELRTPLATVRASAGFLAQASDADPTDRAEAIADVLAEAERMTALVDDLLVLARTDALPVTQRRPVDLHALAVDVCRVTGARLAPTTPGTPLVVLGDEALLRRALSCLVDNALGHGGGDVEVGLGRVSSGAPGESPAPEWATVVVRDHGPGIAPSALPHVFERFYRADPARSGPGSGLGLAIVRSVTAQHGGSATAANAPDGGLLVTLHLPAA